MLEADFRGFGPEHIVSLNALIAAAKALGSMPDGSGGREARDIAQWLADQGKKDPSQIRAALYYQRIVLSSFNSTNEPSVTAPEVAATPVPLIKEPLNSIPLASPVKSGRLIRHVIIIFLILLAIAGCYLGWLHKFRK
jgi:hypothetical protein